ncbi:hypothetical protein E2C01_094838 [Portunus trituberculatus]|uniref:Uncharacterized protein n=1 Tax=Portunus trituberculatus TaxID=210409 RepID=A0A5B7JXZ1_PORTR|nr:hypothetical protein [Portunus trituberculatus]
MKQEARGGVSDDASTISIHMLEGITYNFAFKRRKKNVDIDAYVRAVLCTCSNISPGGSVVRLQLRDVGGEVRGAWCVVRGAWSAERIG